MKENKYKMVMEGTSLVIQYLRYHIPNAEDLNSIPGWESKSYMWQLRVCMLKLKILHAETKSEQSQMNK